MESIGNATGLIEADIEKMVSERSSKFYANAFFSALVKEGQVSLAAYSSADLGVIGHTAITVFETKEQRQNRPDIQTVMNVFADIRHSLVRHGHLRRCFSLTKSECHTLQRTADGRSGEDIAEEKGISRRAVEQKLQEARKKLYSRTTTEAVYKAVAYGILPYEESNQR